MMKDCTDSIRNILSSNVLSLCCWGGYLETQNVDINIDSVKMSQTIDHHIKSRTYVELPQQYVASSWDIPLT